MCKGRHMCGCSRPDSWGSGPTRQPHSWEEKVTPGDQKGWLAPDLPELPTRKGAPDHTTFCPPPRRPPGCRLRLRCLDSAPPGVPVSAGALEWGLLLASVCQPRPLPALLRAVPKSAAVGHNAKESPVGPAQPGVKPQGLLWAAGREWPEGTRRQGRGHETLPGCVTVVYGLRQLSGSGHRAEPRPQMWMWGRAPTWRQDDPGPPQATADAGRPPACHHASGGPGSPQATPGVCPGQAAQRSSGTAAPLRAEVGRRQARRGWGWVPAWAPAERAA